MKREILLLMLTLGFLGCISAQTTKVSNDCLGTTHEQILKPFVNQANYQVELADFSNFAKKTICRAEEDACTITLNLEYDADYYIAPFMAYVVNENYADYLFSSGQNKLSGEVSPGVYDIVIVFKKYSEQGGFCGQAYIIKELVEVSGNVTITINPEEATNHITVKNYGPDGELLKHPLGHFDEATEEWIVDEEGSIDFTNATNVIFLKGVTGFESNSITFGDQITDEDRRYASNDFYVNEVSDRYLFTQARISLKKTQDNNPIFFCSWFSTDDVKSGVLENNPAEYVQCTDTYRYTPYGLTQQGVGQKYSIIIIKDGFYNASSGLMIGNIFSSKQGDNQTTNCWVNVPATDLIDSNLQLLIQTSVADHDEISVNQWTGIEEHNLTGWIFGSPFRTIEGKREIVNFGHQQFNKNGGIYSPNSIYYIDTKAKLLPSPVAFTYSNEKMLGIINDNCPINALYLMNYENNGILTRNITSYYVGRYGETRYCNEGATTIMKYNGEVINPNENPAEKGIYEIAIMNRNIEVDGLEGHNSTMVYFDQNKEDMTPPSIEMLHFKNGDGSVTDRFATGDDALIEFYASDFHYQYYPELWGGEFECQPVEVLVEYAPYGSEDWNELAIEGIPEFYQEPGWGYFYRGSLASVTGQAEKGWFDLKFRLVDKAGNWQEQIISPAFRIDNLAYSSVANITPANQNNDKTIYNLAGQRMNGDLDALPHGIYIVGGKKVVK